MAESDRLITPEDLRNPASPPRTLGRSRLTRQARAWHRRAVVGGVHHPLVLARIHGDSLWSARYAFMIMMSAGIAILGLLLSSPAVIIGAMLISPLMGPIIGLGFALATFDWPHVRQSLLALIAGTLLAVAFTALVVLLSPLQDITSEILARTRPNLFDLLVAVFSALAGGYATVRGRGETIVGVAIATALMPPLAVVGFGLATGNMLVFGGSLALFVTNFIAIALSAALVARFYGFGAQLSPRQTRQQAIALILVLLLLAVPLGVSLRQIAWEAWATRTARTAVEAEFGEGSRVAAFEPNFAGEGVRFRVTVFTDTPRDKATADLEQRLSRQLGKPVRLRLSQILVNQGSSRAQLDQAQAAQAEIRESRLARADIAARTALALGVPVESVMVDPELRRVTVQAARAQPLAELQAIERRLQEDSPGWAVHILPPAGALLAEAPPPGEAVPAEEAAALAWALERLGTNAAELQATRLVGERAADALARARGVAEALNGLGLSTTVLPPAPADSATEREEGQAAMRRIQLRPLAPTPSEEPAEQEGETAERPVASG